MVLSKASIQQQGEKQNLSVILTSTLMSLQNYGFMSNPNYKIFNSKSQLKDKKVLEKNILKITVACCRLESSKVLLNLAFLWYLQILLDIIINQQYLLSKKATLMTASSDKVQFLLQSSLQQTLPLVKKGIFSQQQLRRIMLQRQKHENKLYSSTFKLSNYLKAIEFQYDLERQRLFRIKGHQSNQNLNPLFKKQAKTDFTSNFLPIKVIKRILRLWDRTMHKYRFRTYLWKQYLSFCIAIKSKKHFYKALTNALRFLPFQLELWKIGVRYEVEIGRNIWKARKLFHKGLKLVPSGQKNIQLTKQLIKFQLEFVQMLQKRQKIIQGQNNEGQKNLNFITAQNDLSKIIQSESEYQEETPLLPNNGDGQLLKLREYYKVLFLALADSIRKNQKSLTYFKNKEHLTSEKRSEFLCQIYDNFLTGLLENQTNELIKHILQVTIKQLESFRLQLNKQKLQTQQEPQQDVSLIQLDSNLQVQLMQSSRIEKQKQYNTPYPQKNEPKEERYANEILEKYREFQKFDEKLFVKALKQLCLKPIQLSIFFQMLIPHFLTEVLNSLQKNEWIRVPLKILDSILCQVNRFSQIKGFVKNFNFDQYLKKQIRRINPTQFQSNREVLKQIIQFNKGQKKIEENNRIYRSILVNCKKNIEFIEKAKQMFMQ